VPGACLRLFLGFCPEPVLAKHHVVFSIYLQIILIIETLSTAHCVSFRFTPLQDLNGGTGPDIDLWECHPTSEGDYIHQQFVHDPSTRSLHTKPDVLGGACLTLDRSQPPPPGTEDPWEGR
jgi:hypothetical protein